MFAYIMAGVFAILTGAFAYFSTESTHPQHLKVAAIAAAGSALMSFFMPSMAGVLVVYWIGMTITRTSAFRTSFWQVAISIFLVASCFALIGMFAIPMWLIISVWSILAVVGAFSWFIDTFGDIGLGDS